MKYHRVVVSEKRTQKTVTTIKALCFASTRPNESTKTVKIVWCTQTHTHAHKYNNSAVQCYIGVRDFVLCACISFIASKKCFINLCAYKQPKKLITMTIV